MVVHRLVLLVVGVFACSTAVIMIKLTDVNPLLLSAYRLLVAAFFLLPVYAIAGVLCLAAAVPFVNPVRAYSARDVAMIVGLGLIPTVVGHSVLQYSMKHMRPQLVAIGTLMQFVFAGIMAFFLLAEAPTWTFYLSGALLVTGAVIAIRATPAPAPGRRSSPGSPPPSGR